MNVGLYQAAAALNAHSRWQEVIAENLSSASIPGYKKQELSFGALQAALTPGAHAPQRPSLPRPSVATNFQPGELKFTGVKTDVALEGRGFLEVQLPDGATGYTRDGELQVSPSGQLVTKQGFAVLGDTGPIQLDTNNSGPISISATGEISQGADVKGTLKVAEFDDPSELTPISHGYFVANNPRIKPAQVASTYFHQGYLESANTSPTLEMAHMITAMRLYEANQKVIQAQDERMGRAITELGNG
jgi:flagellar basal-body rod protein FlgF